MTAVTPLVLQWPEIEDALHRVDAIAAIEEGFRAYSAGEAVIPPVGEMHIEDPPGEVHIKYGHLKTGTHYVVKIASGFYGNPALGLPSSQGLMLLFEQRTGQLAAVLLDEGKLTDVRTGAAGAVAAKYLAPKTVRAIGIVGTGIQARRQLEQLKHVTTCRRVFAWGRSKSNLEVYLEDARVLGFDAAAAGSLEVLAERCNLIVTTTPSTEPLLRGAWIRPGTHVTAVGSDTPEKQELDTSILARADVAVADSRSQCRLRGEIHRALEAGVLLGSEVVELGEVIADSSKGRVADDQVTVADLTGVAVQDLQIASAVFHAVGARGVGVGSTDHEAQLF